jgi:hypothetical protein
MEYTIFTVIFSKAKVLAAVKADQQLAAVAALVIK